MVIDMFGKDPFMISARSERFSFLLLEQRDTTSVSLSGSWLLCGFCSWAKKESLGKGIERKDFGDQDLGQWLGRWGLLLKRQKPTCKCKAITKEIERISGEMAAINDQKLMIYVLMPMVPVDYEETQNFHIQISKFSIWSLFLFFVFLLRIFLG